MKRALLPTLTLLAGICPVNTWADMTGKEVFDRNCSQCHAPGNDRPGTLQLALTRGEDKAVLAEREDLAAEYVRYVVRHGLRSMPAFYPSDLPEAQLEALIEYLTRKQP